MQHNKEHTKDMLDLPGRERGGKEPQIVVAQMHVLVLITPAWRQLFLYTSSLRENSDKAASVCLCVSVSILSYVRLTVYVGTGPLNHVSICI
jgi:hypothetical protein